MIIYSHGTYIMRKKKSNLQDKEAKAWDNINWCQLKKMIKKVTISQKVEIVM